MTELTIRELLLLFHQDQGVNMKRIPEGEEFDFDSFLQMTFGITLDTVLVPKGEDNHEIQRPR